MKLRDDELDLNTESMGSRRPEKNIRFLGWRVKLENVFFYCLFLLNLRVLCLSKSCIFYFLFCQDKVPNYLHCKVERACIFA